MYFIYLSIAVLAFIFNIFIASITKSSNEMGVVPVIQLVFIIPIFIICSAFYYFTKNTNFGIDYKHFYILLPILVEILFLAFTKDLFVIFKSDGFIIRSYILSICLATAVIFCLNWLFVKVF